MKANSKYHLPKNSIQISLYLVIFLSGFSALVYQLVWIKKLELFFGTHIIAVSAVLTAFMAGLGIGSLIFGKWSDLSRKPVWILVLIESGLVIFALFFNPLFEILMDFYTRIIQSSEYHAGRIQIIRFLFAFVFLLPPSLLIGGTMPLFMKLITNTVAMVGRNASRYYSLNNFGAFLGCTLTGFFLIKSMGLDKTMQFAAVLNFLNILVLLKYLLDYNEKSSYSVPAAKEEAFVEPVSGKILNLVLLIFTIEGFTTLAYEVIWTRILTEFSYDKTSYLFTVILAGFIFGLSLGSFLLYRIADRLKRPVSMLAGIQVGIGLISILSLILSSRFMPLMIEGRAVLKTWFSISMGEYMVIFLMLTFPVTLMGMTFPLVSRIYMRKRDRIGEDFGRLGFLDVIGSVFGSALTALFLLPKLGTVFSLILIALMNVIPGLLLFTKDPMQTGKNKRKRVLLILFVFIGLLPFLPTDRYFKTQIGRRPGEKILFYKEGLSGTVSVHSYNNGKKALAINGSLYAFTHYDDALSHKLLAYLPSFTGPDPEEVLVIGYGMGITGSSFLQAGSKKLDIAEINRLVPEASSVYFSHQNRDLIHQPELHLINDDGRAYLNSTEKKYDVITCDATHPRYGDNLYTSEFYKICKEHLSEKGILCNWMPFNWIDTEEYKSILASFMHEFSNVSLWYINRGVCLILGSEQEMAPDRKRFEEKFTDPKILEDMHSIDIMDVAGLMARQIAVKEELEEWISDVPANTDYLPIIEYGRRASMAPDREVLKWIHAKMNDAGSKNSVESLSGMESIHFRDKLIFEKKKLASEILFELERVREEN